MNSIAYVVDCKHIQAAMLDFGIEATLGECAAFWRWRSNEWSAGWLNYGAERIKSDVKEFLSRYWDENPEVEITGADYFNPRYHLDT